jgi:hypothetical protein
MKRIRTASFVLGSLLLAGTLACSDDDDPVTGGTSDTVPPTVASVTPLDDYHVQINFNERVTRETAQDESNYTLTEAAPAPIVRGAVAPGDPHEIGAVSLSENETWVMLVTSQSMNGLNFDLVVRNVSDVLGNLIGEEGSGQSFTASDTPDDTAPIVLSHGPAANAINVVTDPTVVVVFSDAIESASTSWTSGAGDPPYTVEIDGATLTLTPNEALAYNTTYTVTVRGTDFAGNEQASETTWSFTTRYNYPAPPGN